MQDSYYFQGNDACFLYSASTRSKMSLEHFFPREVKASLYFLVAHSTDP